MHFTIIRLVNVSTNNRYMSVKDYVIIHGDPTESKL